jgi:hypothetical protein
MPALFAPSVEFSSALPTAGSPLAVTCPGNMPPHFRVQTRSASDGDQWQLFASFNELARAKDCLDRLQGQGESARLIAYRRVPTAA